MTIDKLTVRVYYTRERKFATVLDSLANLID